MKKVIILHGWTKALDKWQEFIKELEKKEVEYEFPKIPGLTESLNKVWDLNDYIKWLQNIVDKEKDKVILIGHSNGGRIAVNFAIRYPERISKLILIDSAGIYHNELPLALKRVIFKTLAKFGRVLKGSSVLKNVFYKVVGETDYKNANQNMKQTMINLISTDLKPILSQIKTPTLIIWGREDNTTPLSDGKIMNDLIKNSKLEIIDKARHSPMFTHPKQVAEIIYGYI